MVRTFLWRFPNKAYIIEYKLIMDEKQLTKFLTYKGYYMSGIEDRLLVERLLNMHLVPFSLEPSERMKKLLMLFATVDENAGKAFVEVFCYRLIYIFGT